MNFFSKNKKPIITILFIIYIVCILRITVFRSNLSVQNLLNGTINRSLFQSYIPLIRRERWRRIIYLFGGNIVCFVPFGMYLQWLGKWKFRTIAVIGLLFSFFIETMQYILGTGVSELDDLILNTFGAIIGAWLVWLLKKVVLRH